jgi:hypothetical protein
VFARVDPFLEPMSTSLSPGSRSSQLKAASGTNPCHIWNSTMVPKTAQPLGYVTTPTYERGVAKEVGTRTVYVPISRFLKVY